MKLIDNETESKPLESEGFPSPAIPMRPYLLRAVYDWCMENGWTPYIALDLQHGDVEVPRQFAQEKQLVLDIGPEATHQLQMGNEVIQFQARFSGVASRIVAPVGRVLAIYAQENGEGMSFPALPKEAKQGLLKALKGVISSAKASASPGLAKGDGESKPNTHNAHGSGRKPGLRLVD